MSRTRPWGWRPQKGFNIGLTVSSPFFFFLYLPPLLPFSFPFILENLVCRDYQPDWRQQPSATIYLVHPHPSSSYLLLHPVRGNQQKKTPPSLRSPRPLTSPRPKKIKFVACNQSDRTVQSRLAIPDDQNPKNLSGTTSDPGQQVKFCCENVVNS